MLFRLIDHYNDEIKQVNKEEVHICFICYENEIPPIKLNSGTYYLKNCKCDCFVHEKCLTIWYKKNKKCPICRLPIIGEANISTQILNRETHIFIFLLALKKNTQRLVKIVSVLFLFLLTFDYYMSISKKIYRYQYDYESSYYNLNDEFINKSYI